MTLSSAACMHAACAVRWLLTCAPAHRLRALRMQMLLVLTRLLGTACVLQADCAGSQAGKRIACSYMLASKGPAARSIHPCCCPNDGCCRVQDKSSSFRLMGFGHRVYKTHDPRAKVMQQVCNTVLRIRGQQSAPKSCT